MKTRKPDSMDRNSIIICVAILIMFLVFIAWEQGFIQVVRYEDQSWELLINSTQILHGCAGTFCR